MRPATTAPLEEVGFARRMCLRGVYNELAETYESRLPARTHQRLAVCDAFMLQHVGEAGKVVELGAGTGRLLARCSAKFRVALDLSEAMCRCASARVDGSLQADLGRLPFKDACLDGVLGGYGSAMEIAPSTLARGVARVLVDEGRFAFHVFPSSPRRVWQPILGRFGLCKARRRWPFELDCLDSVRRLFSEEGLWITGYLLLRNCGAPTYYVRVPWARLLPWCHHVVLVGIRRPRRAHKAVERLQAKYREGAVHRVQVAGGSMAPTIPKGIWVSVLPIHPCRKPRIRVGEVVLLATRGHMVVHRVVGRWGTRLIHRGDTPGASPSWCREWQVLGRVSC